MSYFLELIYYCNLLESHPVILLIIMFALKSVSFYKIIYTGISNKHSLPSLYEGFPPIFTLLKLSLTFIGLSFGSELLNSMLNFLVLSFYCLALTSVETISNRPGLLFQGFSYPAGVMSQLENLLKSLLSFMKTGQQLPSKEAMRITSLTILMSPQLQLSLIILLRL